MCGLAGIFTSKRLDYGQLRDRVEGMIEPIVHRGPDDSGVWADADHGIAFGFRRLAILDVSDQGHQPMRSHSGRFTIVFNGEVYNYRELRAELEQHGIAFRGHSDTEVVLAAFERWGIEAAVRRFIGMFAMAVWDAQDGSLSLVRDRVGIKPLYVHARGSTVLFGSELKALMAHPDFDRSLDPDALTAYFRYLYVPAPWTIFRGTTKVLPGTILTIREPVTPLPPPVPYWSVFDAAAQGLLDPVHCTESEAVDGLDRLLVRAVELRMRSDVPFGAHLSGGIDSSTVAALMQERHDRPVKTFCIAFDQEQFDESSHAATVARHLGTDHTEFVLTGADALAVVPRLARIFDEPFADPSQIPLLLVCELARRDVTVALSGHGGDEIFGGYNRYIHGGRTLDRAERLPNAARRLSAWALRAVPADRWDGMYEAVRPALPPALHQRLLGDKVHKVGEVLLHSSAPERYRALLSAWPDPGRIVVGGRERRDAVDRAFADRRVRGSVDRMMLADQAEYLPDDNLAAVDRVSMAVSLEVRVPLLDHQVIEFSWRLPQALKIRGRRGKWLLRQVLGRRIPASVVERPKMGFSVPLGQWLRGPLRSWAAELIESERLEAGGMLDVERIRRAWQELQTGNDRLASGIWAVVMFEAWRSEWLHESAHAGHALTTHPPPRRTRSSGPAGTAPRRGGDPASRTR